MLTELKCGKTHIQIFLDGICICTVRVEYADVVKAAISTEVNLRSVANRDHPETSTNK